MRSPLRARFPSGAEHCDQNSADYRWECRVESLAFAPFLVSVSQSLASCRGDGHAHADLLSFMASALLLTLPIEGVRLRLEEGGMLPHYSEPFAEASGALRKQCLTLLELALLGRPTSVIFVRRSRSMNIEIRLLSTQASACIVKAAMHVSSQGVGREVRDGLSLKLPGVCRCMADCRQPTIDYVVHLLTDPILHARPLSRLCSRPPHQPARCRALRSGNSSLPHDPHLGRDGGVRARIPARLRSASAAAAAALALLGACVGGVRVSHSSLVVGRLVAKGESGRDCPRSLFCGGACARMSDGCRCRRFAFVVVASATPHAPSQTWCSCSNIDENESACPICPVRWGASLRF